MKKWLLTITLILSTTLLFTGCGLNVVKLMGQGMLGEKQTFDTEYLTLHLTNDFVEDTAPDGYYKYYYSDFCEIFVMGEDFTADPDFLEMSLEEYSNNIIVNNELEGVTATIEDGIGHFVFEKEGFHFHSYTYKGPNAFWFVMYAYPTIAIVILT